MLGHYDKYYNKLFYIILFIFVFACAGSLMRLGLFSSCGERGLLSGFGAQGSHCNTMASVAEHRL